jgi:PAS domain S-box-containing protein
MSDQQRLLLAHMDEGFAACEMLYDESGRPSDYRFLEVNEAFEQQTGLRSADIVGKTALELFPDVERTWIEKFGKVASTGIAERFQDFNRNTGRHFETFAYSPEKSSVLMLIRDITARVQADQSVSQNESRLRLALEVGRMATWSSDYVAGEAIWDDAMVRLLGYPPGAKASQEGWKNRVHPEDLPRVLDLTQKAAHHGGEFQAEYRIFSQNDELRWVEVRGQMLADEHGKVVRSYGVMADITARQRAEESLRESEREHAALAHLVPQVVWKCLPDGSNIYFNQRWVDYTGLSLEQSRGPNWIEPFHPEDRPRAFEAWTRATSTGEPYIVESRLRAADGSYRWFLMRGLPQRDQAGTIVHWFGTCTDIDDLKRTQEELRQANERFELALRNSPIAVFSLDADLRHVWVYNTTSGFEPSDVLGKNDFEILEDQRDAALIDAIKRDVLRTGVGRREDVVVHTSEGERCFDLAVEPKRDPKGNIIGLRCVSIDRTPQKQAEHALEQQRRLTEAVVEQIPCWVGLIRGRDLTYQFVNSAYQAAVPDKQMVGRSIAEVWPAFEDAEQTCRTVLETRQPVNAADQPVNVSVPGHPPETRYFTWSLHPISLPGEDGPGLLLCGWETTARKRAEDALLRSEKLSSVGRMAASMAHEINNPLAATTNLLFLARNVEGLPDASREYISLAQAELNRIAHFTRQSHGFYRESTGPVQIQLGAVLESTVDLFQSKIRGKQANLIRNWEADIEITGVPGELRQLFSNLLANSLDAIDHGGTVRIKLSSVTHPDSAQPLARISIADNGGGIPHRARRQVFEPFFTTKGSIGTGLGLWVGRQLADKHAGRIQMRSATSGPRRGTTFSVTLPMDPATLVQ